MPETLPALRKVVSIPLPPRAAFDLFTVGLADWWPLESHSLSASEGKQPLTVTFQPQLGGRITEVRHDGEMADWASITSWEPGSHLALNWHVGRSPRDATQIDIRFAANQTGGCDITLTHTGFDAMGTAGEAAAANYDEGWDLVLGERFRRACESKI